MLYLIPLRVFMRNRRKEVLTYNSWAVSIYHLNALQTSIEPDVRGCIQEETAHEKCGKDD